MWKDPIVVAANNFRNAMAGENEYVRTQGNNLFITERGTKGAMIVNVGGSTNVNCDTKLPNGQYKDTVSGNTFTVSNGKLTGNIGNRTIATIILKDIVKEPTVSSSVVSGTEFSNSLQVTLGAENTTKATYSINGGAAKTYTNGQSITLGSDIAVGETVKLTLVGENSAGKTVTKTYTYNKVAVPVVTTAVAKVKLPSGWSSANIYVYDDTRLQKIKLSVVDYYEYGSYFMSVDLGRLYNKNVMFFGDSITHNWNTRPHARPNPNEISDDPRTFTNLGTNYVKMLDDACDFNTVVNAAWSGGTMAYLPRSTERFTYKSFGGSVCENLEATAAAE